MKGGAERSPITSCLEKTSEAADRWGLAPCDSHSIIIRELEIQNKTHLRARLSFAVYENMAKSE